MMDLLQAMWAVLLALFRLLPLASVELQRLFGAHGVRGFERSVLAIAGVKPIRETLFGMVEMGDADGRAKMIAKMERFGTLGS